MDEEVAAGELAAPKAAIVEAAKPIIAAKKAHEKWEEEVKRTNDRWEEEAKQRPLAPPPPPKVTIPGSSGQNVHSIADQYEQNGQNVQSANTAKVLATQLGVDEKTIRRDGKFAEAVEVHLVTNICNSGF